MILNRDEKIQEITDNSTINTGHYIALSFFPTRETLPANLISFKEILMGARTHHHSTFKLSTNSSLILLLIPLILPLKDRLNVEFCFETSSSSGLYDTNYRECKNFKEILEASQVLASAGVEVSFSKYLGSCRPN